MAERGERRAGSDGPEAPAAGRLAALPQTPGVYLFRDGRGNLLYIGKARNLRSRVRSYFRPAAELSPWTQVMQRQVRDLEYILTDSEREALILEINLIKRHRPPFNIRFADDKHYPYLRVSVGDKYPRVTVVRAMRDDGARYFGPYTRAGAVSETLRLVRRLFPLRTCSDRRLAQRQGRPCLYFHIDRCLGPCRGEVDEAAYREAAQQLCLFLEGRRDDLRLLLRDRMEAAAARLEFEHAARLRDQLRAVEGVTEQQKVVSPGMEDADVVATAAAGDLACGVVFTVREGKLIGREHVFLSDIAGRTPVETVEAFVKQYYAGAAAVPPRVLLPASLPDVELIADWLTGRRGRRVRLLVPQRGARRQLVDLARKNAADLVQDRAGRLQAADPDSRGGGGGAAVQGPELAAALGELSQVLGLGGLPRRIECFDISTIQGAHPVGSMVVLTDGRPDPSAYRRFRIRRVAGQDDYGMIAEVLGRRLDRLEDRKFGALPEAIIVDGGKGQLGVALEQLRRREIDDIAVAALAKEHEWLYLPGRPEPVDLGDRSPARRLLQRLRDEAHRFAVTYHRMLRSDRLSRSLLDEIEGIGPARKRALLRRFGSVRAIRDADLRDLAAVPGVGPALAREIKQYFGR